MKTVGDWKVNEAWLQQVYKRVCMDKTNLQCLQQFECQHAVANTQCILIVAKPLLTRVYVNIMLKMLAPHIVWSVGQTKHS